MHATHVATQCTRHNVWGKCTTNNPNNHCPNVGPTPTTIARRPLALDLPPELALDPRSGCSLL